MLLPQVCTADYTVGTETTHLKYLSTAPRMLGGSPDGIPRLDKRKIHMYRS